MQEIDQMDENYKDVIGTDFSYELSKIIEQVSKNQEVVSLDETQRRQAIYVSWAKNMETVHNALIRNPKVIVPSSDRQQSFDQDAMNPVVVLLREYYKRRPDRMILSPVLGNSVIKGSAEDVTRKVDDVGRKVSVSYWPDYFPDNDDDNDDYQDELDFSSARIYDISDVSFKKEIALFVAGKLQG